MICSVVTTVQQASSLPLQQMILQLPHLTSQHFSQMEINLRPHWHAKNSEAISETITTIITMHFYTTVSSTDTLRGVVGFEAVMSDSLQSFLLTNYAVHQLRPEVNRKILSSKGVIKLLKNRISRNDPIDINGVQDISTVHDLCCIWRRMIMLSDWKHLYSLDYSNGLVVNT